VGRLIAVLAVLTVVLVACSDDDSSDSSSEPTATYDGDGCTYDGPSEFEVNSEVTFTYINETDSTSVGFGVWLVPEGTTAEDIEEQSIFGVGTDSPLPSTEQEYDSEQLFTVTFSESGLYALNCFDAPGDNPGDDYPNLVTVTE
jgi:hypothetical protein